MDSSEPPSGSRYDLVLEKAAPAEPGAAYFEVHDSDVEVVAEKSDEELIGYVHSTVLGSSVDGPGLRFFVALFD